MVVRDVVTGAASPAGVSCFHTPFLPLQLLTTFDNFLTVLYPARMKTRTTNRPRIAFMNVSMPAPLRDRLSKKVQRLGSYGSTSDYIRDLIRRDLDRDAIDQVDRLLLDGINSGPAEPMTAAWRKARRAALAKVPTARSRKSARA